VTVTHFTTYGATISLKGFPAEVAVTRRVTLDEILVLWSQEVLDDDEAIALLGAPMI